MWRSSSTPSARNCSIGIDAAPCRPRTRKSWQGGSHVPSMICAQPSRTLAAANVPNIKPRGPSVDDAGLALDLAARGEGVALARSLLARSDIEAGRLVPLFDLAIRDRFAYWLVVRPGIERRSDVSAFTEWIRRECVDSVGAPT